MFNDIKAYYYKKIPHLTEAEWLIMESCLEIKNYRKGDHVIKQGEVCNYVYFINKGFLRIYGLIDIKEISIGFIGAKEYLSAYESFLTRAPCMENIDVMEDAELFALSFDNMQMLYEKYPVFESFGRKIAEYLYIWVSQRSNALLLLTPEQRYISMIENNSQLFQLVPQYMLASFIGVTPEHLSRIRKKLSAR